MLPIYQYKDIRIVKTKMVAIPWLNLFAIIPVGWVLGIAGEVMSLSFAISAFWAMVLTCLAFLVRKLKINKILSSRTSSHIGSPTKAEFDTCIDRSFINSFYSDSKTDKVTIQPFDDSIAGTPNLKRSFFNEMPKYMLFDLVVEDFDSKGRKANIYYATLCEIKLRQPVINLIFDSRSARGSQFKVWLLRSQRLKMPLEFEKHFTTYSPKYHAIETLQLITPEVLEAMIDLKDSDIEFVGDSLLCFGPLLPIKQLADFRSRCLTLHDKVNDNLPYFNIKGEQVCEFGGRLLKNPFRLLLITIPSGLIICALIFSIITADEIDISLFFQLFLVSLVCFSSIWSIRSGCRFNKQAEAEFLRNKQKAEQND